MKQLIVIIGPNGVGKSTTARKMVELYAQTAYVDSDWCRVMNPFMFTEITKQKRLGTKAIELVLKEMKSLNGCKEVFYQQIQKM